MNKDTMIWDVIKDLKDAAENKNKQVILILEMLDMLERRVTDLEKLCIED